MGMFCACTSVRIDFKAPENTNGIRKLIWIDVSVFNCSCYVALSLFFWQKKLPRLICQLVVLWRWSHLFIFGRLRLFKLLCCGLHHCELLIGLNITNKSSISLSFLQTLAMFCYTFLSLVLLSHTLYGTWQKLSFLLFYQVTMGIWSLISSVNDTTRELAWRSELLYPSTRVGWKVHSLTNTKYLNLTKVGLFFNIISSAVHTFLVHAGVTHQYSSTHSSLPYQWFSTFLLERNPKETFQWLEEPLSNNSTVLCKKQRLI